MDSGGPESFYSTCPPDWSAGVLHVGREQCAPGHNWQGVRDHYLLHYVCAGRGSVQAGSRRYELDRGDAFLYAPGSYLNYTACESDPWYYLWVGFRGLHVDDLIAPLGLTPSSPIVRMAYSERVESTLRAMIEELAARRRGGTLIATGLLYEVLGLMADACVHDRPVRTTAADLVGEARIFVQQNYQREIDVADVVRHIGVDRSHFSRVFRESEGVSLRDFLIRTRMERAMRLIRESELSMRAVAASVGYRTYASFERRFKESFGYSPSEARAYARSRSEVDPPPSRRLSRDARSIR